MTIDEIRELLRLFNESGVGELEIQRGEDRLRIRKAEAGVPEQIAGPAPMPRSQLQALATPPVASNAAEPEREQIIVKSPIVGTFYEASAPDAPPFVKVGDSVEPGQVLCIIESMKLMNEIEAEIGGAIAAKLVENGSPVEYGQALFAIKPR
jgi:acetyl-CoA carboxylase biotin carboxyl carrier protein